MLLRRKIEITEMLLTYRNRVYVRKIEITEMLLTYRNRVYVSIFIDIHKHKYTKIIWMKNFKLKIKQADMVDRRISSVENQLSNDVY